MAQESPDGPEEAQTDAVAIAQAFAGSISRGMMVQAEAERDVELRRIGMVEKVATRELDYHDRRAREDHHTKLIVIAILAAWLTASVLVMLVVSIEVGGLMLTHAVALVGGWGVGRAKKNKKALPDANPDGEG